MYMSFVSLSSAACITFSNASSEKRERRETKLAKVGVTLWKGNSGSSLEMTTPKALKSWSSHDLPWPSHETLFFSCTQPHLDSFGILEKPNMWLQRATSYSSGGLHQHSNHHPQYNSRSTGIHSRSSSKGFWTQNLRLWIGFKEAPNKKST